MKTGHYDFIEIGTSDFDTLIEVSDDKSVGLSIEPIKYYLDRLPNKQNVKKLESAISDTDGYIDIYHIPEEKIIEHNLPWWVRGSNSVNNPHPFTIKEIGEELYNSVVKIDKVPTLSWKTLIEQENIQSIDYLKVDTEGFDHIILNDYLNECEKNPKLFANKIKFERHTQVSNLEEIDKIIPKFKDYYVEYHESDVTLTKVKIPRIIHQTYKTNELPKEISEIVSELKLKNPEFEYRFYNDDDCYNFIKQNYDKETLELYSSINPSYGSAKADFFRYLLMYKVGGVYLDIKSFTEKPLKQVILPTDEFLLSHWEGRDYKLALNYEFGEFQNWHIICVPGHPFLKETIEIVKSNIKNYNGATGKLATIRVTGPIAYSKAILKHLFSHKTNSIYSPVREFRLSEELGLIYNKLKISHRKIYGPNASDTEPLIITKNSNNNKVDKAYVLYANESYFDIVSTCAKSIREFSNIPIFVYLLNSDLKVNVDNTTTINWVCDLDSDISGMYNNDNNNFYINRSNEKIYRLLIQRPLITKDVLEKYSKTVAYVDSDSIATQYVDRIFDMYNTSSEYPYFVEGVYDYLHINGRGGAESREDLSTTLEHPSCELFNVNQYIRERYRQTGYYVAGENTIPFLEEWYWMCINPKVLNDFEFYAPYHEETIMNVLLWKYNILNGLPYIYVNGGSNIIKNLNSNNSLYGKHIQNWVRIPENKKDVLFFHGEKRIDEMEKMIDLLRENKNNNKINILFLAPHLSTGGMPSYLLKRIQELVKFSDRLELFVVEYSDFSPVYVVQKNKIKELIKPTNFWTLGSDKNQLIDIIKNNNIDIVHVDEMLEGFESFNQVSSELMSKLYDNNRTWKIVETCHNVWFDPNTMLNYHPDAYSFCTPYHKEVTFKNTPSYSEVMEYPIDNNVVSNEEKINNKIKLGFDLNKINVVNVGLWTSGKNQGEAVEVAKLLPNVIFHFVGNQAPNFENYWGPIMKSLPNNVKIWGERDDVDTFLKAADIFMFNSTWECNPLVIREAASYGLKIMSRNLPQYMGMFDDYITEISQNDSINDIKNKLELLINIDGPNYTLTNQSELFANKFLNFYEKVNDLTPLKQEKINKVSITQHFVDQPYFEIKGESDKLYTAKFFDEDGQLQYHNIIRSGYFIKLNRKYYTKWRTQVWEDETLIYDEELNLEGKRVYIALESKSLGDSIAWIPYMLEFKKKHNCHVIVSTFWNNLFEKTYPEIEFINPGVTVHNLYALYRIGWFYDSDREPVTPNTIRLQEAASNILGLEFKEIKPEIDFTPKERPFDEKYVTIANESTSGLKYWNNPTGWQELVDYLISKGYRVINVSKNGDKLKGVTQLKDTSIPNTMNVIHHSEFFIGLSSGLSWLSWALGKQVVMISNFTEADHEFTGNCVRITNPSVCNGCWNNPKFVFDKGDWYWCPEHKNTPRQFECHKSITSEMVINQIQHLIK